MNLKEQHEKIMKNLKDIKLYTLWELKREYQPIDTNDHTICHGLWQVNGYSDLDKKSITIHFKCVMPYKSTIKIGDTRKMYVDVVKHICKERMIIDVDDWDKELIRKRKLERIDKWKL